MAWETVQLPNGDTVQRNSETGKILLEKSGSVYQVDEADALANIEQREFRPASVSDVDRHAGTHATTGQRVRTFATGAATGAFDAATSIATLPAHAGAAMADGVAEYAPGFTDQQRAGIRRETSGAREFLAENLSGRGVLTNLGGAIAGPEGYSQTRDIQRQDATQLPGVAMAGRTTGQVVTALAMPGMGGMSAGAKAGLGALEGGAVAGSDAVDDSYVRDHELTAQQYLGSVGVGAILGGSLPLGGEYLGSTWRAGRERVTGMLGRGGLDAAEDGAAAMQRGVYRTADVSDDTIAGVARRAGVENPEPGTIKALRDLMSEDGTVNDLYSRSAAAISGADEDVLRKFGAGNLSQEAADGRKLWINRSQILDTATTKLSDDVSEFSQAFDDVTEVWRRSEMKADGIRAKIQGDATEQLLATTDELYRLRELADEAANIAADAGNARLGKSLRTELEALGAKANATNDIAERFVILDRAKKSVARWADKTGRTASRVDDPWKMQRLADLSDHLETMQEGTRQVLMNSDLWGEAANVQRAVNGAWEDVLDGTMGRFRDSLTRSETGYRGARRTMGDTAKTSAFLSRTGKSASRDADDAVRNHVIASRRLIGEMASMMDLAPEQLAAAQRFQAAADSMQRTLSDVDATVRVANQIDDVVGTGEGVGSQMFSVLGGGMVGGIPGAVLGAAVATVTNPGQTLKQVARLEAMTGGMSAKIRAPISRFLKSADDFARGGRAMAGRAMDRVGAVAEAGGEVARKATLPVAVKLLGTGGEERRRNFDKIAAPLIDYRRDPQRVVERIQARDAEVARATPKLAGFLAGRTLAAIDYLSKELPGTLPSTLTPRAARIEVSDSEMAEFAEKYTAVNDPMSVLEDLTRGGVSFAQIDALKAVYPALYDQIRQEAIVMLAERKDEVPYEAAKELDLLLDLGGAGDPLMDPGFMQRAAAAGERTRQQTQSPRRASPNRAKMFETTQLEI